MRLVALPLAALAWLAPASTALAADHVAPPGNSGVNEYVESLPSISGNRPVGPSPSSSGGGLDRGTAQKLRASGVDGRAAAQVLAARAARPANASRTASEANGPRGSARKAEGHARVHAPAPVGGDSKGATLLKAATGTVDGGIGLLLPVVLVATLLAAGAFALLARRWRTG